MGVGTTALTLYFEMEALKHVSASVAALIYTSEPLWGAGLAWALLGDRWGGQGWFGAGLIIAASLFTQLKGGSGKARELRAELGGLEAELAALKAGALEAPPPPPPPPPPLVRSLHEPAALRDLDLAKVVRAAPEELAKRR
jgi:hypothetical protein